MSTQAPRPEGPITSSVEKLRTELDRWLEAAWSQGERAIDAIGLRTERPWAPAADVVEDAETVRVLMNLPGVDPQTIDVTLVGHMLTIRGQLPASSLPIGAESHLQERPTGEFSRSIPLPATVDPDAVDADSELGVLQVTIGKAACEKSRTIPVRDGAATSTAATATAPNAH